MSVALLCTFLQYINFKKVFNVNLYKPDYALSVTER